jgi:proteasome lid subunit RPN8/RPN11
VLRFSPYAWAKLLFLRDCGNTEVGGFALSAAGDLLLVEDLRLIRQRTSVASVCFDDEAVADDFDLQIDAGLPPERFFRIWIHTHPGDSAEPSGTDEETFQRVFGRCDWAVMAILSRGGETTARLRFNVGPGGDVELPVRVDYSVGFPAADHAAWEAEYDQCVRPLDLWRAPAFAGDPSGDVHGSWADVLRPNDPKDEWDFYFNGDDLYDEDDLYDGDFGPLCAAEGAGAAGETDKPDGDGDRRGRDRPAGGDSTGGAGCAAAAVG